MDKGKGKTKHPSPTPRLPHSAHSPPVGNFMAPHRCLHCEDIPDDIFPLPPYSVDDPDPPTHYEDLFPPNYTPFSDLNTTLQPVTNTRPPTPLNSLKPPPHYDSLFAAAVPSDSAAVPPGIRNDPYCWDTDASSGWDL